jgi:hypothetical protein
MEPARSSKSAPPIPTAGSTSRPSLWRNALKHDARLGLAGAKDVRQAAAGEVSYAIVAAARSAKAVPTAL